MPGAKGRPSVLPADGTVFDGPVIDVPARLGWLLRVNRLCSVDAGDRAVAAFARRLRAVGVVADGARVSRWESGRVLARQEVVAGYEAVLRLPAGALRSVGAGLLALTGGVLPGGVLPGGAGGSAQERLDVVYERTRGAAPAGGDWWDLAALLAGEDRVLVPTVVVEELVGRLVAEMMRAAGTAYTTRFQALAQLIMVPRWTGLVAGAIDAAVRETGAQGVIDPVSLLGEVGQPWLVRRLLGMLADQAGPLRAGAAHALLNLVITGVFPAGERPALEVALRQLAADGADSGGLAALVGARLPAAVRHRIGLPVTPAGTVPPESVRRAPAGPAPVGQAPWALWRRLHLDRFLAAAADSSGVEADPMLGRLLAEAMASRYVERRHHASLVLLVSPYRAAVAEVACRVAEHAAAPATRRGAGQLLGYLAGPAQLATLRRWAADPSGELRTVALAALAHVAPRATPTSVPVGADRPDAALDPAVVYAAGMTGHPVLRRWAGAPAVPAALRVTAGWWLRHGPAVLDATPIG